MNYLVILIYISIILLIFLISSYLIFKFTYFYKRTSSGVVIFKIDNINKRVIRNNKKCNFLSTYLDSNSFHFSKYNYISINEFLNFFNKDSSNKIKEIINKNLQNQESKIEVFWNNDFNIKLRLFERIINKFNKKLLENKPMKMVIKTIDGNNYYCSLKWGVEYKDKISDLNNIILNDQTNNDFLKNKKNIIIGLLLKNFYFLNKNNNNTEFINDLFGLNNQIVNLFKSDDYIYLILKYTSKNQYNNFLSKINEINNSSTLSKIYKKATIIQYPKINIYEQDYINDLVKYSLYNIDYDSQNYSKYYFNYTNDMRKEIQLFNEEYYKYKQIITDNKDPKKWVNIKNIVNYISKNKTQFKIIEPNYERLKELFRFYFLFDKNEYLSNLKELNWFNYFSKNSTNLETTQLIFKMSQSSYLYIKQEEFKSKNIIPMIYDLGTMYDINSLENKILSNYNNEILTFFYLENINRNISFLLEKFKIKAIIISKSISSKLYDSNIFLDCLNLSTQLNKNKKVVIYESPPENLEQEFINKIKINYNY
ncbi:MHO_4530 family protein [Mycoplasma sp. CSL7503-lung]|uniref:MHO_4530 family protein n=1 Tax=Mycoplasma sp. CSL7503-lung TaxID=536372 RepID=UPI0021D1EF36|nr:hypothetical protein [Mycoplasma sp. CSL7503-lung]MCU4706844.1 hypothetical protein [Mycoplasma sp. CSL7503-lung]